VEPYIAEPATTMIGHPRTTTSLPQGGLKVLEDCSKKMASKIIYYIAPILDPRVEAEGIKIHLKEKANSKSTSENG
jgi:hypothetical protein